MSLEAIWYAIVAAMLATYVALDGFDFGAGMLHLFVAKKDEERRTVYATIGPVWDGNEVWLVASGGVLFFAFPKVYAASFSGFYLPLTMVLWLLMARGLGIELRGQIENPLWRAFWDASFALSSGLLAFLFGVAFGNVVRGVSLGDDGTFSSPLFTDFSPQSDELGALDWYTILVGLFAMAALVGHGALYLAWKTEGHVGSRSLRIARAAWWAVMAMGIAVTWATWSVSPWLARQVVARPWSWPLALLAMASPIGVHLLLRRAERASRGEDAHRNALFAFLASCTFIASALLTAAAGLFPAILRAPHDPSRTLDAHGSASGAHGLSVGLVWWTPAMLIAIGYTAYVFRSFRGPARSDEH